MRSRARRALSALATALAGFVRGAAGTDAYAQYRAHALRRHPGEPLLSREEFFRRELTERWSGLRRCC